MYWNQKVVDYSFCLEVSYIFLLMMHPYYMHASLDTFKQVWMVKIFPRGTGNHKRAQKCPFLSLERQFSSFDHLTSTIKMVILPTVKKSKKNLKAFSHPWCNTCYRYGAIFNIRNTQFVPFLSNNHSIHAWNTGKLVFRLHLMVWSIEIVDWGTLNSLYFC